MLHSLLNKLDQAVPFQSASAHCDIPCKIYDPSSAQIAVLSVIRFIDLIGEINAKSQLSASDNAQLIRLVREKEIHAKKVKDEINVIWGDYFKQPQFEQFPNTHTLVHTIMLTSSACKQSIDRQKGLDLLALVNEFASSFWATKGIETYNAKCPYPPSENTVYPTLT